MEHVEEKMQQYKSCIMIHGKKDVKIRELTSENTHVLVVRKDKKKEKKIKAMKNNGWHKKKKLFFQMTLQNSATNNWKQQTRQYNCEICTNVRG